MGWLRFHLLFQNSFVFDVQQKQLDGNNSLRFIMRKNRFAELFGGTLHANA